MFQVEPSRYLRRDGADVHSDVHISIAQAVFGGTIKTPSVYDDLEIKASSFTAKCKSFFFSNKMFKENDGTNLCKILL